MMTDIVTNISLNMDKYKHLCSRKLLSKNVKFKFARWKDDITGDLESSNIKVKLPCGHATTPESLKAWCMNRLAQGFELRCPAETRGVECGAKWCYTDVRKLAFLTDEEEEMLEEKLAHAIARKYCEYKQCPGCNTFVERKDTNNLQVECRVCSEKNKSIYEFCWQCLKPWKNTSTDCNRCGNDDCKNMELEVLKNCILINLPESSVKNCPSIRACPTCGLLIEHMSQCKYMTCIRCHYKFCFACLESANVCEEKQPACYYAGCATAVVPRQERIPQWHKNAHKQHLVK